MIPYLSGINPCRNNPKHALCREAGIIDGQPTVSTYRVKPLSSFEAVLYNEGGIPHLPTYPETGDFGVPDRLAGLEGVNHTLAQANPLGSSAFLLFSLIHR
nr:hypothetical protein [Microvirga sp.]